MKKRWEGTMYISFQVKNFRCFQDIKITEIKRVNLIAGMNNVGKTSLLEGFFIHAGAYNPEIVLRVNAFRGIEKLKLEYGWWNETPWMSLFNNFNILNPVELTGEIEKIRAVTYDQEDLNSAIETGFEVR